MCGMVVTTHMQERQSPLYDLSWCGKLAWISWHKWTL